MLVKIGQRLIDEEAIECIEYTSYTDHNGLTHKAIHTIMKNGNKYRHKAKELNYNATATEIDEINKRIIKLRESK